MRILYAALVGVLSCGVAEAADVIPNHERFPLHPESASKSIARMATTSAATKQYVPVYAQAGLSGTNLIAGATGNPTLNDAWSYADSSVQQQSIGTANGVAGLDANGRSTSPINTTTMTGGGGNYGQFPGIKTAYGTEAPSPHLSVMRAQDDNGNAWDAPGDYIGQGIQWDHMWMLGGHRAHDYGEQLTFGWPDSGGIGAVVDGVYMNGMSAGQGSGVSAGAWGTMAGSDSNVPGQWNGGYMNYDAAARSTITGSTAPHFVVSSQVNDPEGNSHSITFNATGATFSPALPVEWSRQIHPGMNLMTNVLAVAHANGNAWSNPTLGDGPFRKAFNMYGGTITGWHTNAFGQVDSITLDTGWFLMQQTQMTGHSEGGAVPMKNTLDGSPVALDTYFTNWTAPAIEFGVFTKAFPDYKLCYLQPPAANPDINNPNGRIGSLVHECDNEWDLWSDEPKDYLSSMHGLSLVFTAKGKLTLDSYGIGIAGQGALPLGQRIWNLLDGSISYQAMGNGNLLQHNIYQPEILGSAVQSQYTAQAWQFGNGVPQNPITSSLRITQYRDTTTLNGSGASVHIGYKYDGTPDPQSEQGASAGAQVVFNPDGYEYGVGIGAGGTFQSPSYGLIVPLNGPALLPRGYGSPFGNVDGIGAYTAGGNITFTAPTTAQKGMTTPFLNTDGISAKTNGGVVTFTSPVQNQGLVADAVYTLAQMPMSGVSLVDGAHAWCSDCKTPKGHIGMPIYWRASEGAWTDAMDNPLSN